MDQVTQQNAAMVEETTAATHNLKGETDHLAGLIARFRTRDDNAQRPRDIPPVLAQRARLRQAISRPVAYASGAATAAATDGWEEF